MTDSPLRILYVNHVGVISGAEKSLLRLLESLDRTQVEPLLAAPEGPLTEAARALGIQCFAIPPLRLRRSLGFWQARSLFRSFHRLRRRLSWILWQHRPHLIHGNSLIATITVPKPALTLLGFTKGTPVIWHARDLRIQAPLAKNVLRKVQAVIAISRAVQDSLSCLLPKVPPIHVIYNGLNHRDATISVSRVKVRENWEMGPDTPLLGCAGQLVPWKRQDLFLRVGAEVIKRLPEARLVIIGGDLFDEHRDYVKSLHDLAAELGIADHVLWLGYCSDMPSTLAALDVLVHPADQEPLGRVIMEAMAVGLPCIAFDQAGPAELIENEVSGLLVPEGDVSALAAATLKILTDLQFAVELHDGALARAADFDAKEQAAQVLEVYRQVIAKR